MKKLRLRLAHGTSYPIFVGHGILSRSLRELPFPKGAKAYVFADARLKAQARELVQALRHGGWRVQVYPVPATEGFKDFSRVYPLYGRLLKDGADRHSVIFALGGGVIGDAIGFVAGTFLRGIPWVGVPTTLLAQVDSAIGGKTAVNHPIGKNLVGVFHQPAAVICEIPFLKTLSARDRVSGLGEMVKYGITYDPPLFGAIEKGWKDLARLEPLALERAIARCIHWKARAVSRDERDVLGIREVLNFGHSVGHALEAATGYGYFRHGEAVILGMRAAVALSVARGHLDAREGARIERCLASLPVPALPRGLKASKVAALLRHDKKARDGRVRFVLLKRLGKTVSDSNVTRAEAARAIEALRRRG